MSTALRLRIESDGTSASTRVVDVQTGRILPVQAVTWTMDMRSGTEQAGMATATIVVPLVQIDAEAPAEHAAVDGALYFVTLPVPNEVRTSVP